MAGVAVVALSMSAPAQAGPPADPVTEALARGDQESACRIAVTQQDRGEFFSGTCYETGTGIAQDFERAAELFRAAMQKYRHSTAQAHLGQLMVLGHIPGGTKEGLKLLRQAAERGGAEAVMLYGRHLAEMPGSRDEAIRWLKRSADSLFPGGAYELARVYKESGDSQMADIWQAKGQELETQRGTFAEAVAFAQSGKERESARTVYNRAHRILIGQDAGTFEQAVAMVRDAARDGLKEAEAQLGLMYQRGIGMPLDREEAIYWFRRAALHGSPDGERLLREELAR